MLKMLAKAGYQFDETAGVWSRPAYCSIAYSDGQEVEERIRNIIDSVGDRSVLSEELRAHCTDWPSSYHLSSQRANLLRPFVGRLKGDILEIGAGCGAITRYLGECGGRVLALEGSVQRAAIARGRTRDLPHVSVVAERIDQLQIAGKFDVVTVVGVLEYAGVYGLARDSALQMLEQARQYLKPEGVLLIAIENQLGLKYFAGAPEDHVGYPMYGIENLYRPDDPQTYGRQMLKALLMRAGFRSINFLAAFPDYKFPVSIVSERGFASSDFDAAALASQSVAYDPQLPKSLTFSPELVWPVIIRNRLGLDLANSFLIAASASTDAPQDLSTLAWHYSSNRRKLFCKETSFKTAANNQIEVIYRPLLTYIGERRVGPIRMSLAANAPHVVGIPLSLEITDIISRQGWTVEALKAVFVKHLGIVQDFVQGTNQCASAGPINSPHYELPGFCFDVVPHNILGCDDGTYHVIDREWELDGQISAGYLVFRTILNLVSSASRINEPKDSSVRSPLELIEVVFDALDWPLSLPTLEQYAVRESDIQRAVKGEAMSSERLLTWLKEQPLVRGNLSQELTNVRSALAETEVLLEQRVVDIDDLVQRAADDKCEINRLEENIRQREAELMETLERAAEQEREKMMLAQSVGELKASTSWQITRPLRFVSSYGRRVFRAIDLFPDVVHRGGGLLPTLAKAWRVARKEGVRGIRTRFRMVETRRSIQADYTPQDQCVSPAWNIVPYYVDPRLDEQRPDSQIGQSMAVHLHLFYEDMLPEMVEYLDNIPVAFDLYVSVSTECDLSHVRGILSEGVSNARVIIIEKVPNRGRDIAPLIVQFGARLAKYDIVGHFHTKRSPHNSRLEGWRSELLAHLLGPKEAKGGRIAHFLSLLSSRAKLIFPEGSDRLLKDASGWADNRTIADEVLRKYSALTVDDFLTVEFPEGSMFWSRADCLQDFLSLPLTFDDFDEEPVAPDGTLAHALERLVFIFARDYPGDILRLHRRDSVPDYTAYEAQEDCRDQIVHGDIKVLAYYLPQFHPTPENDEWHGKGFTEWTKVRSANPLFQGHYQQHIPHGDIGYYLLDSPETLRRQSEIMAASGVAGMIFYHYWFGGRMILERPAQMLLDNDDISMPFCFCWANENWTKRWDGNESEILLAQSYSEEDAREFIRYLIPFFSDSRYIRVDGRPVLFIYRPSSIPNIASYIRTWEVECNLAGVPVPYLVAVLTRGATDPTQFGMDAGVERVLHDWTNGAVPEVSHTVKSYHPINGSILSYEDVADFYSAQTDSKEFTYFRSLIPAWDNTPRYGSDAYIVHGSTPEKFHHWLTNLIDYSKRHLPEDRRLIVVNAWNEWAEGAHLEPDSRFGYAYLNAVGRALADQPYSAAITQPDDIKGVHIHLDFAESVVEWLADDPCLEARFFHVLKRSTVFRKCKVSVGERSAARRVIPDVPIAEKKEADFVLEIRRPAFFLSTVIEKLVEMAISRPETTIIPNFLKDGPLPLVTSNGSISPTYAYDTPMVLYPRHANENGIRNVRMRADAHCFPATPNTEAMEDLPVVTTIIRVHSGADFDLLGNALCSVVAMHDCISVPLIAAQDLSDEQIQKLDKLLSDLAWYPGLEPILDRYASNAETPDLRSKMLNESLMKASTRYVAFLDYDDLLFPHAYRWLINRLASTGKAVSFGRVYDTSYSSRTGLRLQRSRTYEYGYSYQDFVSHNHAPLHSFLIDRAKISTEDLEYHDGQRYMEDYFMTLQIFKQDNCDWDSLHENMYLGEYLHSVDRPHTLAFSDEDERRKILSDPEYQLCERRINELRQRI